MSVLGKKAVIFDLDGTLVDSLGVWSEVDQRLARLLGAKDIDPIAICRLREETLARFCDDPSPYTRFCGEFGKLLGSPLSAEEIHAKRFAISRRVLKEDVCLRAGAADLVRFFAKQGMRMCVVTTTRRANIDIYCNQNERICSEIRLNDYMEFFITVEDVEHIKPDPEGYLKALSRLDLPVQEVLAIEDSVAGLSAAKAAGLETLVVGERHSEHAKEELKSLSDGYWDDVRTLVAAVESGSSLTR